MRAFFQAVFAGVLAGALLPMLGTVALALGALPSALRGGGQVLPLFGISILPLIYTVPLVLVGSLVIGLPVTVILKKINRESAAAYVAAGAAGGLVVPLIILLSINAPSGYWACLVGAFSGGMTGATWWTARKPNVRSPPH